MKTNTNGDNKMKTPEVQLISDEEYSDTMERLVDIQIAADAAVKSINKLKALIAETF